MAKNRADKREADSATATSSTMRLGQLLRHPTGVAALAGLISLGVYLGTLAPTVLADDSAELVTAIHVLGVPHPTGYPVYLLLGKLFDLLPFATPPIRVGLLSVLCGAGAVACTAWAAARLTASATAGLLAGLVAALNGPMWSQATQPEVYALSALIIALAVVAFVRWETAGGEGHLIGLAFLLGLGLAHHRAAIFFTAPLFATAAVGGRAGWRLLIKCLAAAALPLLSYIYVPLRVAARPALMWGGLHDWGGVATYVLGTAYECYVFARPLDEVMGVARDLTGGISAELTLGGLALSVIGMVASIRRQPRVAVPLIVGVVLLTAWNLGYRVGDWDVFFVPAALPAGLWAGAGLRTVTRFLGTALRDRAPWAASAVGATVLVLVPASMVQQNWPRSHRGEWKHYDKASAVLGQLEPKSVYVSELDAGFFLPMYLQVVEGRRRDVLVTGSTDVYEAWTYEPEVTPAIQALMGASQGAAAQTPEARSEHSMRFAAALAEAVGWERPVYCFAFQPWPPRYLPAIALWSELFLMTTEEPEFLTQVGGGPPIAEYDGGISLAQVTVKRREMRPSEPLEVELDWRCERRLDKSPFVLVSIARREGSGEPTQPRGTLVSYGTWLAYGREPLPPTPPGSAYRQQLIGIAPTNAQPGDWVLRVGIADSMDDAVAVQEVAEFRVLPARKNGGSG